MAAPTLKHDKKFWEILGISSWPILPQAQIVRMIWASNDQNIIVRGSKAS